MGRFTRVFYRRPESLLHLAVAGIENLGEK
jgi:hypothetical protein